MHAPSATRCLPVCRMSDLPSFTNGEPEAHARLLELFTKASVWLWTLRQTKYHRSELNGGEVKTFRGLGLELVFMRILVRITLLIVCKRVLLDNASPLNKHMLL